MTPGFYLSFLSNHAKCFLKVGSLRKSLSAATFPFPAKALTESQPVNACIPGVFWERSLPKLVKIVAHINERCSALSNPFHMNGNTRCLSLLLLLKKRQGFRKL